MAHRKKTRAIDPRSLRGRRAGWVAALLAGLALLVWLVRERSWTVDVVADPLVTTTGTPVTLTARVSPATAVNDEWVWTWTSKTGVVEGKGRAVTFVSSTLGEHHVKLKARSSRGTEHDAEVVVTVANPTYYVGIGPNPVRVERPADDPMPDVEHPELPYRIRNVTVDKPSVCRGEKVTVRVEADDFEGKADWLLPSIAGSPAWTSTMVVPGAKAGRYKIPVMLTDPDVAPVGKAAPYQQTSVFVELKDCELATSLGVATRKASAREEDVYVRAQYHTTGSETPAGYAWDFGDGSGKVTTREATTRHLYPGEEQRGTGRRVFSYVVHADAVDASGKVLASGVTDLSLRNRAEEDERTRQRIDLMADYSPLAKTEANGDHTLDVTIHNLSAGESATLDSLEYQVLSCDATPTTTTEQHGAGEVFASVTVPPRGSVAGHMVWPAGSSACRVDVSVHGTSAPSGYPAYAGFSMRVQLTGPGVTAFDHPADDETAAAQAKTAAAIDDAMAKLHKNVLTKEDIELLVSQGQMDEATAHTLLPSKARIPPRSANGH
jgi:hypothetical protein